MQCKHCTPWLDILPLGWPNQSSVPLSHAHNLSCSSLSSLLSPLLQFSHKKDPFQPSACAPLTECCMSMSSTACRTLPSLPAQSILRCLANSCHEAWTTIYAAHISPRSPSARTWHQQPVRTNHSPRALASSTRAPAATWAPPSFLLLLPAAMLPEVPRGLPAHWKTL